MNQKVWIALTNIMVLVLQLNHLLAFTRNIGKAKAACMAWSYTSSENPEPRVL